MELTNKQIKQIEELTGYKWNVYRFETTKNNFVNVYLEIYFVIDDNPNTHYIEHYEIDPDEPGINSSWIPIKWLAPLAKILEG